jgi:hypothetical protein
MRHITKEWLARVRPNLTPAGEIITRMQADPDVPRLFASLRAMRHYVSQNRAYDGVPLAAVTATWVRYRDWVDRHPVSAEN